MITYCQNCGEEFEDPRPGAVACLFSTGASAFEICAATHSTPYCPACSKEANRLNEQARRIMVLLSNNANGALKEFGRERRIEREHGRGERP